MECAPLIAEANGSNLDHTRLRFETSKGNFEAELFDNASPVTVRNFKAYVAEGFYDDTLFHRVLKGYVIHGGRDASNGSSKEPTRPAIVNEAKTSGCRNQAFTLGMARLTTLPDSATSEFFINTVDNPGLDPNATTPDGYAVFGIVYAGRETVRAIENVTTTVCGDGDARRACPRAPVLLHSVREL